MLTRILALLSLILMTSSLLLALRLPRLARLSGGLAPQFRWHHRLGVAAGILIGLHAGWELWQAPASLRRQLIMTDDPALLVAWIAFFLFLVAWILSYQRQLKFRIWRRWHLLFPLAFALVGYHAFAFAQDQPWDQALIHLSYGLGAAGLLLMLGITLMMPDARRYAVRTLRNVTASIWELQLEPRNQNVKEPPCRAGQVVYVRFPNHAFSRALHPFSVASCHLEPYLRLYIKSLGRDTAHLEDLRVGDEVELLGPFVELPLDLKQEQIWIGGGIGIAPFLGFLRCVGQLQTPPLHVLHYVSRPEECLPTQELEALQADVPALTWQNEVNTPGAEPDLRSLDALLKSCEKPRIVICGPNAFMRMVRRHLQSLGVPPQHIVTEELIP